MVRDQETGMGVDPTRMTTGQALEAHNDNGVNLPKPIMSAGTDVGSASSHCIHRIKTHLNQELIHIFRKTV